MKTTRKPWMKWGEGICIAVLAAVLAVFFAHIAVNRLPRKSTVQPVHAVSGDLFDFALVDINSAPAERLMELPGVGSTLARKIIEGRPYCDADDLLRIDGVGEGVLAKIRPYIKTVEKNGP